MYACSIIFCFYISLLQIIHGEVEVNADSAMGRVSILMHAGKKCLKWIAANVPIVLAQNEQE